MILIFGPTSSGKTSASYILSSDYIVVNSDSQQVYRDVPVITAQPQKNSSLKMYGYVGLNEDYSVLRWLKDCVFQIQESWRIGKTPVLVGGSYMYIDLLINGISDIPPVDILLIKKYESLIENKGTSFIKERFIGCSKYKDKKRLVRSAALLEQTGKTLEQWHLNRRKLIDCDLLLCALIQDKSTLYNKINTRFVEAIENGAIQEAELCIQNSKYNILGVKQINEYILGNISLEEAVAKAQQSIRRYAKRQITWMRNCGLKWKFFNKHEEMVQYILKQNNCIKN